MPVLADVKCGQTTHESNPSTLGYNQNSSAPAFSGYNIPPEDWNHARALATKYPPQIVLWIIREVACQLTASSAFSVTPNLLSISSSNSGVSSVATFQTIPDTAISSASSQASLSHDLSGLAALYVNEVDKVATPCSWEGKGDCVEPEHEAPSAQAPDAEQPGNRWFCVFDEHRGKSFGKRSDWRKHMSGFHAPGKKSWQCPDCHQIFDQVNNFSQHHRMQHCRRSPCKHAAKKLRQTKRAFACGRQSCESLLSSWDEWQDHVAQHLESGMTVNQWHYNTLFRNLLRRPEIHSSWNAYVSEKVHPYNITARFNWRPRNTLLLKLKLEYNEAIFDNDAGRLVEDAYQTGLEVRSADELLDSSTLIVEPTIVISQLLVDSNGPQQQDDYQITSGGSSSRSKDLSFETYQQDQEALQPSHQHLPLVSSSALSNICNQVGSEQSLGNHRRRSSFLSWETSGWWDYDLPCDNAMANFTSPL